MAQIVRPVNKALVHAVLTSWLNMVCNTAMSKIRTQRTPHSDKAVIDELGGSTELAKRLGLDPARGGVQRVDNWKYRGIPAAVRLQHLRLFGRSSHAQKTN
jgi:hypothetical protein